MTATILEFRRPSASVDEPVETLTVWWTCPDWCTACVGGETLTWPDGGVQIVDRVHTATIAAVGPLTVQRVRYDDPTSQTERVEVTFGGSAAVLSDEQWTALRAALLHHTAVAS